MSTTFDVPRADGPVGGDPLMAPAVKKRGKNEDPPDPNNAGTSVFDPEDARSIYSMVPGLTKAAMERIPLELRRMSDADLRNCLKPDATLCRLRISFWQEYERAQIHGVMISLPRVTNGVCTRDYWDTVILVEPKYLAWVVCPPRDYTLAMHEMLDLSMERLRELLELPFKDPTTGRLDGRLIQQVIDVTKYLDARVKGAIIRRMAVQGETKNFHVHADGTQMLTNAPAAAGEKRRSGRQLPAGDTAILSLQGRDAEDEMSKLLELERQLKDVGGRLLQKQDEIDLMAGDEFDIEPNPRNLPNHPPTDRPKPVEVAEADYIDAVDPDDAEGMF